MKDDPNHTAYVRGDQLYKEKRFYDAAKWFQIALDEWPEDWQAMWALGDCHSERKKPNKAEAMYRMAMEHAPTSKHPDLLFNLGNALYDQHQYTQAIETYQRIPPGHQVHQMAASNITLAKNRERCR